MRHRGTLFGAGLNAALRAAVAIVILLCLCCGSRLWAQAVPAQTATGSIRGQVTDPSGGAVPGASVQVTAQLPAPGGQTLTATAGNDGAYDVRDLAPGQYTVSVTFSGFAPYTKESVTVAAGQAVTLNVSLAIAEQTQQVTVSGQAQTLDTSPAGNASAVVISGKELDALPDDPDELQADLEALAGPSAGPNGGQMYIGRRNRRSAKCASIRIPSRRNSTRWDSAGSKYSPNRARIIGTAPRR